MSSENKELGDFVLDLHVNKIYYRKNKVINNQNYFFCGDGRWDMPLATLCLIRLYLPSLFSIDNESKTHYVCHTFVKTQ